MSGPVFWPKDLLPQAAPNARILTYGYDTKIRHWIGPPKNQNSVRDIAWNFLVQLEATRRDDPSRPLLFIAHSLGGIVVKELLRRASACHTIKSHLHPIFASTIGLIFFGTPHAGSDPLRPPQKIAELLLKAAGFTVNEQIVNTLLPSSDVLRQLREEFSQMAHQERWTIYSFQEALGIMALDGRKVRVCLLGNVSAQVVANG